MRDVPYGHLSEPIEERIEVSITNESDELVVGEEDRTSLDFDLAARPQQWWNEATGLDLSVFAAGLVLGVVDGVAAFVDRDALVVCEGDAVDAVAEVLWEIQECCLVGSIA